MANFFLNNVFVTAEDLTDCCLFQVYQQIKFFCVLSLVGIFASVVVLFGKKKICLGLLKKGFIELKWQKKADG